jgi:alanyl-tRNA synthetase
MTTPRTSDEIRSSFLDFFHELSHEMVDSSPLVPTGNNSTLLFTNAGMNQFTEALLGLEKRPYTRATTSQKVMRVSGKHNDLDNVGPSPRHQTFFEMLGNFSFGDYFKKEAIAYAWMFLTDVVKLDKDRLWVTVYNDDDDAAKYWEAHVAPERILRFGADDNFWSMGDTGPCGPCSEIFFYNGPIEEQDGAAGVNVSDDYLEVWNLVFMQYDRLADGSLQPLPATGVDTGMGLERITQVVQGVTNNYDTDIFISILDRIQQLLGDTAEQRQEKYIGYRVIADHARAVTHLISDGVLPGNEGRAYVLRLILRRALRFGKMIGFTSPFIGEVVKAVIAKMGTHYTQLKGQEAFIVEAVSREEAAFQRTLDRGLAMLDDIMGDLSKQGRTVIPGSVAFSLYDTHGFPYDLTRDIAAEKGFTIDRDGFDHAMAAQRTRSRAGDTFDVNQWAESYRRLADQLPRTDFIGYDYNRLTGESVMVQAIVDPATGTLLEEAATGSEVEFMLDVTSFYAESGGQVADTGTIETEYGRALVTDVQKPVGGTNIVAHRATIVSGTIRRGERAAASVDVSRRYDIMRNHTATHLLHKALHHHLGNHATQRGSLVAPDYLRFDFNNLDKVSDTVLEAIEHEVNIAIRSDSAVSAQEMTLDDAKREGAMMLFGEKYGDVVRLVSVGDAGYSRELCGGTHLRHTGEIGMFLITREESISSGVRRIIAVTGNVAEQTVRQQRNTLRALANRLGASQSEQIESRLDKLQQDLDDSRKQLVILQRQLAAGQVGDLLAQAQEVNGVKVLAVQVPVNDANALRDMADRLRDKLGSAVVVLAADLNGKHQLLAAVTPDVVQRGGHAGNLIRELATRTGGKGGGRPDMAQAGVGDATALATALSEVGTLVARQLKG